MERAFEKLEEYILDEEKIVTISSFARDANISLADAKEVLNKYVDANKSSGKIHSTYILNGITKNEKQNYVAIVNDLDLEEKRQLFEDNVIQTVFSIQKSDIIDFNLIVLGDENPVPGSIVSKNCTKRVIKKEILPSTSALQSKSSVFEKQNSTKSDDNTKSEKSDQSIKKEQNRSSETTSSNVKPKSSQGGIANMFSKMSQNKSDDVKPKQEKETAKLKKAGISGFFTKMSSSSESIEGRKETKLEQKVGKEKATPKESSKEDTNKTRDKVQKKDLFDSDSNEEVEQMMMKMDVDIVKEENHKKPENKKEKKPVKKRRAKNDAENNQSTKRRKRIVAVVDSDSDDMFVSSKEELSERDEEPVEEVVKKPLPPRNKRRKAVDKTYQDEEGFIVTKTEYVYVTASEDENEESPKKPTQEKSKANLWSKKSHSSNSDIDVVDGTPQKGKRSKKGAKKSTGNQPTLMNFFIKK